MKGSVMCYWSTALLTAVFCVLCFPALAEKRVALVIGNSSYKYIPGLANPVNDAEAIAEKLWMAGFEVIEAIDADLTQMQVSLATFANRLAPGDEAIFYFAGHGVRGGTTVGGTDELGKGQRTDFRTGRVGGDGARPVFIDNLFATLAAIAGAREAVDDYGADASVDAVMA